MRLGSSARWKISLEVMQCSTPGRSSGSHGDARRRDRLPVRQPHDAVPRQGRALQDLLDPGVAQVAGVDAGEPVHLGGHIVAQGRPVEPRAFDRPAEARRDGVHLVRELGSVDKQLLGHAAPDHAGPADPIFLRDRDLCAVVGRHARRAHAGRTGADHEEVEVMGHVAHPVESALTSARARRCARCGRFTARTGLLWFGP